MVHIKSNLLVASMSVFMFVSPVVWGLDYFELEDIAQRIACVENESSECVDVTVSSLLSETTAFVIDGVELPPDALRDRELQKDLVLNDLYLRQDHSVGSLDMAAEQPIVEVVVNTPKKGPDQVFSTSYEPKFPTIDNSPVVINIPD